MTSLLNSKPVIGRKKESVAKTNFYNLDSNKENKGFLLYVNDKPSKEDLLNFIKENNPYLDNNLFIKT